MTPGAAGSANIHLKRASQLTNEVERALEGFRKRAIDHDTFMDNLGDTQGFGGWLVGMAAGMKSRGQLRRDKAALATDLQLASEELDRAEAIDPQAALEIEQGMLGIPQLRAAVLFYHGQTEMIWGTTEPARSYFLQSLAVIEAPDPHYMLGLLYESEYKPKDALKHFERCLELEPDGELSVPALREANAMRNYKKKFRGDWGTFFLLLLIWPAAIVYFVRKWK